MRLNDLIEKLRQIQDSKGNLEVMVQDYGRVDAPRAFSKVKYTTPIKVKIHMENPELYEADYNPKTRERDVKEICLIAYI